MYAGWFTLGSRETDPLNSLGEQPLEDKEARSRRWIRSQREEVEAFYEEASTRQETEELVCLPKVLPPKVRVRTTVE